jgi:hypothetical protein
MQSRSRGPFGESLAALRTALADRDLARLLAAWLSIMAGKWAFLVGNLVIAYDAGGAVAVGIMGLARYVTPTIVAPLSGIPTARWPPVRVLVSVNAVRTGAVALAALVVAADLPFELLCLAIALEAGVGALTRPLHMSLLPSVSRTPEELVAANVSSSAAEGLGTFLGPAIAGAMLALSGPLAATLVVLVIYALGLIPIASVHIPPVGKGDGSLRAVRAQVVAGLRTARDSAGPRLILIALGMQTMVRGILVTLTVVASIELLGMGEPGVGVLNAAMGIGGLLGAVVAISLSGRARLFPAFALALAGWGAPIAIIGLVGAPVVALGAMVLVGTANAVLDVAGFTLAQRTTPNRNRVAFLGLFVSVANGGVAIGGLLAPILLVSLGTLGALVAAGVILPVTTLVLWPFFRRVDETGTVDLRRVALVRGVPLFAPLSLATVEHLAESLVPTTFAAGGWLMREGEVGDRFVIVEAGEVEVLQGGVALRHLGPGEGIGEIALVHDIPRTASVRAVGAVTAWALDRESFLTAITGTAASLRRATSLADERRNLDAPGVATTTRTDEAN